MSEVYANYSAVCFTQLLSYTIFARKSLVFLFILGVFCLDRIEEPLGMQQVIACTGDALRTVDHTVMRGALDNVLEADTDLLELLLREGTQ